MSTTDVQRAHQALKVAVSYLELALAAVERTATAATPSGPRVISIPGPDGATRVTFERKDGSTGHATLVTTGTYRNLWRCDGGGTYDWAELLMANGPLEVAE